MYGAVPQALQAITDLAPDVGQEKDPDGPLIILSRIDRTYLMIY